MTELHHSSLPLIHPPLNTHSSIHYSKPIHSPAIQHQFIHPPIQKHLILSRPAPHSWSKLMTCARRASKQRDSNVWESSMHWATCTIMPRTFWTPSTQTGGSPSSRPWWRDRSTIRCLTSIKTPNLIRGNELKRTLQNQIDELFFTYMPVVAFINYY